MPPQSKDLLFSPPRSCFHAEHEGTCYYTPLCAASLHFSPTNSIALFMRDPDQQYFVYILASKSRVLYIGITRHLAVRIAQHKSGTFGGFTTRYKTYRLVYFERFSSPHSAISREKQLKGWIRSKKIALIE